MSCDLKAILEVTTAPDRSDIVLHIFCIHVETFANIDVKGHLPPLIWCE